MIINGKIEDIEYAEDIIVLIKHNETLSYFVSEKTYWVLNYVSWANSFDSNNNDYSSRFDIPIVDKATVDKFLQCMECFRVSEDMLREFIFKAYSEDTLEDNYQYFPALYIDFDSEELISKYPELLDFERFIPEGWTSPEVDFFDKIPDTMKYWIKGELDLQPICYEYDPWK